MYTNVMPSVFFSCCSFFATLLWPILGHMLIEF